MVDCEITNVHVILPRQNSNGYMISQVTRAIVDLMLNNNILVLVDLITDIRLHILVELPPLA